MLALAPYFIILQNRHLYTFIFVSQNGGASNVDRTMHAHSCSNEYELSGEDVFSQDSTIIILSQNNNKMTSPDHDRQDADSNEVTNQTVRPELQSRVNNGCITFVQSPLSPVVIDDQSRTD